MTRVRLNARFRLRPLTGVERFAAEVSARLARDSRLSLAETAPAKPLAGLKGHAWEQFALPRHLGRDEVLFSPCNTGPVTVSRQLVVVHDAAVWDCPEGFSRPFRAVYRQLLPRLARRAAVLATVSQFSRRRLAERLGIDEGRILVLGNAASPDFSPGPPNPVRPATEEGLVRPDPIGPEAKEGLVLLCVGSMEPRKNLGRLLRAWLALQAAGRLPEGARLELVGGANPRNFAGVDRVEGAGIDWLGRVGDAELVARYRRADAFVYPSLYEGFGLPPLEAMACGCPALLSRAASLPEVGGEAYDPAAADSSGAVLYFDPESEEEIAASISRFLGLAPADRERMRRNALARAARFSWDEVADRAAGALAGIAG
jgi:glycosyltransferase involved in cell wall biosynthesis